MLTWTWTLRTQELKVQRLVVGELHAAIRNVQGKLELQTEIKGKAGEADARFSAPLAWGDRMVPTTDGQIDGTLQTRALRLSALLPLLEGSLSELDGSSIPTSKASIHGSETQLTGHALAAGRRCLAYACGRTALQRYRCGGEREPGRNQHRKRLRPKA